MSVEPRTSDEVLAALADCEGTAVSTARISAALNAPKPYVTVHLQQLALRELVGCNTHEGTRRWRLTEAADSPGRDR